ncbi:tail fiber domain-containing protein [Dyadobacter fermentans]|uniref:tail fiber domain-containing protein n=1 Tax=Dyadobacter fermentans TaxID=94254 RepID=UPI001CBE2E5D|nr:tail fiber domain-containing protein [Dyadobacter fermentans]MBZ1357189.1 tail fiber domain-containing protein [Dyadobacter fermentans]
MQSNNYFILLCLITGLGTNQTSAQNTILGLGAGSGGLYNTHVGAYAGHLSTASQNSFFGHFSGRQNTTGRDNSFIGFSSGFRNTSGHSNTFLGTQSGSNNLTGAYNTFIGISGTANTNGNRNSFLGYHSGGRNTNGHENTFLGNQSGYSNVDGSNNTFAGFNSGYSNQGGHRNVYVGNHSGYKTTSGYNNVFLGHYTGYENVDGQNNVFIGYKAGFSETGSRKLYIDTGDDSQPLLYGDFNTNTLSIGTKYTGAEYKLVIPGRVRATQYDVVSDARLKQHVRDLGDVLKKIVQIKGVAYTFRQDSLLKKALNLADQKPRVQFGFLAQDIQKTFPELVTDDAGVLAVNYQGMVPVVVEALKALIAETDSIVASNATITQNILRLQQRLDVLETKIERQASALVKSAGQYELGQNHPNPFDQLTTVRYSVSEQARQVQLVITDQRGTEVKRFDRLPPGSGQVQIMAGNLKPGIYHYTLVANGKPVNTHNMLFIGK